MQVYKSSVMIAYEKGSYFVLSCHWTLGDLNSRGFLSPLALQRRKIQHGRPRRCSNSALAATARPTS